MSKFKLVIDFTPYPAAELVPLAQNIQQRLNALASSFPNIPVGPVELLARINALSTALVTRENGGKAEIQAADLARHDLESALHDNGEYLNGVLDGSEAACQSVGYPYYPVASAPLPNPPHAPTNLVLRHGAVSGVVRARYKPDRRNSYNEIQACAGDPNVAANWQHVGFSPSFQVALGNTLVRAVVLPRSVHLTKCNFADKAFPNTTWERVRTRGKSENGSMAVTVISGEARV